MKQFFSDLIREERGGKFSSKKAWGHAVMIAVVASYVCDGLDYYKINETLFGYMLLAGCVLLGLKIAKQIAAKIFGAKEKPDAEK